MIKKIIPALSISSMMLISMTSAHAHQTEGWYTQGSIGNITDNSDSKFFTRPLLGASLGFKNYNFRGEAEYRYQRLAGNGFRGDYNSFGLNGFYDFDNHTIFSPYVGVGVAYNDYSYSSIFSSKNSVNVNALAGLRTYLTDDVALDLRYRTGQKALSLGVAYQF